MKTECPLVSVIVPIYNTEKYLRKCIDSILRQTYRNLEIILVDDGSTDECPRICDEYAQADSRIIAIHQENGGISSARNAALRICKGDIIAFVDSDDWLEPTAYEELVGALERENCDIAFMAANRVSGDIAEPAYMFFPDGTVRPSSQILHLVLRDKISGQPWMRIYRRQCWGQLVFPVGRNYEDLAISHLPFANAERDTVFVGKPLYNYLINPAGISMSPHPKKAYDIFLAFRDHYDFAVRYSPEDVGVCLYKTVIFGLETTHSSWRSKSAATAEYAREARSFICGHRTEIKQNLDVFDKTHRYTIRLFWLSPALYKAAWKTRAVFLGLRNKSHR